jgi:hypothetical protein
MSNSDYERWWSLHVRVAKGESLSDQETLEYELGLDQLEDPLGKDGGDTLTYLRALRATINRAAALHSDLLSDSFELEKKIAELESAYQEVTGQSLNVEPHAPA